MCLVNAFSESNQSSSLFAIFTHEGKKRVYHVQYEKQKRSVFTLLLFKGDMEKATVAYMYVSPSLTISQSLRILCYSLMCFHVSQVVQVFLQLLIFLQRVIWLQAMTEGSNTFVNLVRSTDVNHKSQSCQTDKSY